MAFKSTSVALALLALHFSMAGALRVGPRQADTSDIPAACQSICDPILNHLQSCDGTQLSCVCSDSNDSQLAQCLQCEVDNGGALDGAQEAMDGYAQNCASLGADVADPSLSGGSGGSNPSSGGSSVTFTSSAFPDSGSGTGAIPTPTDSSGNSGNGGTSTALSSPGAGSGNGNGNGATPSSSPSGGSGNGSGANPLKSGAFASRLLGGNVVRAGFSVLLAAGAAAFVVLC